MEVEIKIGDNTIYDMPNYSAKESEFKFKAGGIDKIKLNSDTNYPYTKWYDKSRLVYKWFYYIGIPFLNGWWWNRQSLNDAHSRWLISKHFSDRYIEYMEG